MYIGIDIGGTNIKTGVVDSSGTILLFDSMNTDLNSGPLANIQLMKKSVFEMLIKYPGTKSIGIGVPGIIDKQGVLNISPNLPGWHGINLQSEFQKDFNVAIAVDNDANAAAMAELEQGAGQDLENFIFVTLGTGIGGSIIIDKKIFRGSSGGAGEIGHTIINYDLSDVEIPTFRQGILEVLAGRNQIITNYQLRITNEELGRKQTAESRQDTITNDELGIKNLEIVQSEISNSTLTDVEDIANLAKQGFKPAVDCMIETGEIIGMGLASAMNLLDIPDIIIGGGISQSGDVLFESIKKTIKKRALPTISERFEIREAHFKNNAGLIGAAMLGANKLKEGNT